MKFRSGDRERGMESGCIVGLSVRICRGSAVCLARMPLYTDNHNKHGSEEAEDGVEEVVADGDGWEQQEGKRENLELLLSLHKPKRKMTMEIVKNGAE